MERRQKHGQGQRQRQGQRGQDELAIEFIEPVDSNAFVFDASASTSSVEYSADETYVDGLSNLLQLWSNGTYLEELSIEERVDR